MPNETDLTIEETCERGKRWIAEKLSPEEVERLRGQMVVVDVLTGEMAFDRNSVVADSELRKRVPNPVVYIGRVGFPTAIRIGGSSFKFIHRTELDLSTTYKTGFRKRR